MKTLMTAILIITFVLVAGCGEKEEEARESDLPGIAGLHRAAGTGDLEAIKAHIEAGSDLNVRDPEGGACPLSTASLFGQTKAALALIEAGADLNCRGNDGATPLHVAAFFCRVEIVKALLENGADRSIKNKYGSTPIETVTGPYDKVKPIYEHFEKTLGIGLDYERIQAARPEVAEMLK